MSKLELFRGHFYNWYDTSDLHPLEPRYISSVDSGNLAGHLLALGNGCREIIEKALPGPQLVAGLEDTGRLLREALVKTSDTHRTHMVTRKQLNNAVDTMIDSLRPLPDSAGDWAARFAEWRTHSQTVADIARALAQEQGDSPESELQVWIDALRVCVESHVRDAEIVIPWMRMSPADVAGLAKKFRGQAAEWLTIERSLRSVPTLADAPDKFDVALSQLAVLRARLTDSLPKDQTTIARIDTLTQALRRSTEQAVALVRRLSAIAQTAEQMFHAMDFGFLFNDTRKLFAIGYRVADAS